MFFRNASICDKIAILGQPPRERNSLAKTFNTLHMRYSQYLNTKRRKKGHLWQGRFYSSIFDENHLYAAIKYVENNPARAQIVESPEQYRWSSTNEHLRRDSKGVLTHDCFLEDEIQDWLAYLKENEDKELVERIRQNSMSGRPCGSDGFIQIIERVVGRRLRAMPRGRPKIKNKSLSLIAIVPNCSLFAFRG